MLVTTMLTTTCVVDQKMKKLMARLADVKLKAGLKVLMVIRMGTLPKLKIEAKSFYQAHKHHVS